MKSQLLIVVLLSLALATVGAGAVATDISGMWVCSIDRASEKGGPFNVTFVFNQEGEKLTGTFSGFGPIGEQKVAGTVNGDKVVFGFDLKGPGDKGSFTATFNGTIESPTKMTGAVGSPFCGAGCKWAATKKKK
jgi:hypothetical protein